MSQERGNAQGLPAQDLDAPLRSSVQQLAGAQGSGQQHEQMPSLGVLRTGIQDLALRQQLAGAVPRDLLLQEVPNPLLSPSAQQQQWLQLAAVMGAAAALPSTGTVAQPPAGSQPGSSAASAAAPPPHRPEPLPHRPEPLQRRPEPPPHRPEFLQQAQQPEQAQEARRRGRKAKPAEQLTEKQLRTREQNRRYEEKQKVKMRETEAALEATSAQLEQERAHQQQELQTSMAYEQLVDYKSEMVGALQVAAELDPPHGISIPEEMQSVLAKYGVIEQFGSESIMRYVVGGHTAHLGLDGRVREAPPFEAVASDWADIASSMRAVLNEARVPRQHLAQSEEGSSGEGTPTEAEQQARAQESVPGEAQQVEQPKQGLKEEAATGWGGAAGAGGSGSDIGGTSSSWAGLQSSRAEGSSFVGPACILGCALGAEVEAAMRASKLQVAPLNAGFAAQQQQQRQEGDSAPSIPQGACQSGAGGDASSAALGTSSSTLAAASAGGAAVAVGDEGAPTPAHRLDKAVMPELQQGMAVHDGDDLYRFTGAQVMQCGLLFRRIALVCWQQAALFPNNASKLVSMNLETCSGYEEQELPRWRAVVRQMRFSPEELEKLVGLHKEYIATLRPALLQRREALQRLRELHAEPKLTSQQDLMTKSLIVSECNSALMKSVHVSGAATGAMSAGLWKMLQFPLGVLKMVVLSWPYYPQLHMIGLAAAEELGLDMGVYTSFNELFANLSEEGQQ